MHWSTCQTDQLTTKHAYLLEKSTLYGSLPIGVESTKTNIFTYASQSCKDFWVVFVSASRKGAAKPPASITCRLEKFSLDIMGVIDPEP